MYRTPANLFIVLIIASLVGCVSRPAPPLLSPELETRVTYYAGDPIGGLASKDVTQQLSLHAEDAIPITARFYLLTDMPGVRFDPLMDHARLIIGDDGTDPLQPQSPMMANARLVLGADAESLAASIPGRAASSAVLCARCDGLALPGLTTSIAVAHLEPITLAGHRQAERHVTIELWREPKLEGTSGDRLEVALIVSDVVDRLYDSGEVDPSVAPVPRTEKIVLDAMLEGAGQHMALFAPARFDPTGRLAYLLVLEQGAGDAVANRTGDIENELAHVRDQIDTAHERGQDRRRPLVESDLLRLRRLQAVDALQDPDHAREALVVLAGDAPIASGMALMADDAAIATWSTALVPDATSMRERADDGEALAWSLERSALALLQRDLARGELPPEFTALLLRWTGDVGRAPGVLEASIARARNLREFQDTILNENRIALEDPDPAARVRAFDWLSMNGFEVTGFDPLDDRRARRQALRDWADQQVLATDAGPTERSPQAGSSNGADGR